jgi:hypothetical protein
LRVRAIRLPKSSPRWVDQPSLKSNRSRGSCIAHSGKHQQRAAKMPTSINDIDSPTNRYLRSIWRCLNSTPFKCLGYKTPAEVFEIKLMVIRTPLEQKTGSKPCTSVGVRSRLAAEDRCHLNGMAMRDGRLLFVTAVSTSDIADGWRVQRREAGVAVDVDTRRLVCRCRIHRAGMTASCSC